MTTGPEKFTSSEDSRSLYQRAIDMAWRTEKIDDLLRERGESVKADMAANVMVGALLFLDPSDRDGAEAIIACLGSLVDECDGYDSGARKYEQIPESNGY